LILHALLAWVDLGLFKRPISTRDLPKTLIIDIFVPRTAKKSSVVKGPSIVVKEPILEKKIKRNVKRKPRIKPKSKDKKRIQPRLPQQARPPAEPVRHPAPREGMPGGQGDETLANLPQVDLAAIHKEGGVLEEKHAFIPDMVDIPMALGKIRDIPNRVKEEGLPDSVSNKPITYALPIYQKNTPPQYPLIARRRGYQGKVLLEVLVKKDGKVGSIRLARSSGYEILDSTAIKGVRNWLFHPAKRGDELVEMWVKIPIRFQLR
jgi:protein TonB